MLAGRPVERPEGPNFLGHAGDLAGQADAFRGAGPDELEPRRLDAERFDGAGQQLEAAQGLVVLLDVVALARVAAADQTASAPSAKALSTNVGSRRPEHISLMSRTLGGYLVRAVPARSAAR